MTWYGGAPWAAPLACRPRAGLPGPVPLSSFALGGWAIYGHGVISTCVLAGLRIL